MGLTGQFARVPAARVDALREGKLDAWSLFDGGVGVDKAWHGMHFLLTGEQWATGPTPAGQAVMGGTPVGEDGGYGPPRLVDPADVKAIAAALAPLTEGDLRKRFEPSKMTEIYPSMWDEGDWAFDYVWEYFTDVRALYLAAAKAGDGVLIVVT